MEIAKTCVCAGEFITDHIHRAEMIGLSRKMTGLITYTDEQTK